MRYRWIPLLLVLLLLSACAAQTPTAESTTSTCTLTVRCDTALAHPELLSDRLSAILPADGCIIDTCTVTFAEGESVFDVLRRELDARKLHYEYNTSPVYNTAYIEGICNLYELDCGPLSGWTYSVNGDFPSYGVSQYQLHDGDAIAVLYTCDLGEDVGNHREE